MKSKIWPRLGIAAGVAGLLFLWLAGILLAQSGISLVRSPAPPVSISLC
jgi:hypothetical protein